MEVKSDAVKSNIESRQIGSGQTGDGKTGDVDILGSSKLKWTGMVEFDSDDH